MSHLGSVASVVQAIRQALERRGYVTTTVSNRDGFTIFVIENTRPRLFVWVRKSPVTDRALRLFNKMLSMYKDVKPLMIRLGKKSDFVTINGIDICRVETVEEAIECIYSFVDG